MNDTNYQYGLMALRKGAEAERGLSALPEKQPKRRPRREQEAPVTAPEAETETEALENTAALSEQEDASEKKQQKRNRRLSWVKLAAAVIAFAVVILIGTISWFTMNRESESNGMSMTASDLPFEIASKGELKRNESVLLSQTSEYVNGSSVTLNDSDNNPGTYYVGDSLILRFDPRQQDDPQTPDVDERYLPDIDPGQSGKLNLFIIPKIDSQINVTVSLKITAFAEIDKYRTVVVPLLDDETGERKTDPETGEGLTTTEIQQDGTSIIRITNAADFASAAYAAGNPAAAASANDYVKAAEYLRGHILFFGGEGDTSGNTPEANRYYYTDPYTTQTSDSRITFTFPVPANNSGKAVEVPIYWMWTNTFGQIALPNNVSGQRNGYPVLADNNGTDKTAIINYLKNNRASIFANNGDNTESYINAVTTPVANAADFNNQAFSDLSRGYNQADYAIGTRISYFLIEASVEENKS